MKENAADWTEASRYKTTKNNRNVYFANKLPMRHVLVLFATHSQGSQQHLNRFARIVTHIRYA